MLNASSQNGKGLGNKYNTRKPGNIKITGEPMKNELMKLLKKKAGEGKMLSEDEKSAKMDVLDELSEMMGGEAAEGLKKVTVMSPTKEGMEAGLEKAKEVMEKKVDAEDAECEMMDEEGFDQEIGDDKAERIAELKAQIAELEG